MKKVIAKGLALAFVGSLFMAGSAMATLVKVTYTADNIVDTWFIQGETGAAAIQAVGGSRTNWQVADTMTVDLEADKDYSFIWEITNEHAMTRTNPAGFLAEIDLDTDLVLTSAEWTYASFVQDTTYTDNFNSGWIWRNVTEYGNNGGSNIWTIVHGGAVAGISTTAEWIWSEDNGGERGDQHLFIRADVHTAPVPEPATMLLFGTGLVGLAGYSRKRMQKK